MDGEKKCLILSNRAYEEYLQIETRRQQSKAEEPVKKEEKTQENTKEKEAKNEKLAPEVQKIIDQGDAFIRKIHECNEAIPGEEISKDQPDGDAGRPDLRPGGRKSTVSFGYP